MKISNVVLGLVLGAGVANGAILIREDFTGYAEGAAIGGRLPTVSQGGWFWSGPTAADPAAAAFSGTGSDSALAQVGSNRTALIDLGEINEGEGYFASNRGVYTLSATIAFGDESSQSWFGIGFSTFSAGSLSTTNNLVNNGGHGWMNLRLNGQSIVYRGSGTSSSISTNISLQEINELRLQLDTSGDTWYLSAWINDTQFDLNGASEGMSHEYTGSAIPDLRSVAISTGANGAGVASVADNFTLTFEPVPEPAAVSLAGIGVLAGVLRRRR